MASEVGDLPFRPHSPYSSWCNKPIAGEGMFAALHLCAPLQTVFAVSALNVVASAQ